jgi:hypothetical protein
MEMRWCRTQSPHSCCSPIPGHSPLCRAEPSCLSLQAGEAEERLSTPPLPYPCSKYAAPVGGVQVIQATFNVFLSIEVHAMPRSQWQRCLRCKHKAPYLSGGDICSNCYQKLYPLADKLWQDPPGRSWQAQLRDTWLDLKVAHREQRLLWHIFKR